jgi:hypothetical protein
MDVMSSVIAIKGALEAQLPPAEPPTQVLAEPSQAPVGNADL